MGERVPGVDVDEVEPGPAGAQRRRPVPAPQVTDVALRHRARLHRIVVKVMTGSADGPIGTSRP